MSEASAVDIALGDVGRLEEVVDREGLSEICRSFHDLFGLSIRVFSMDGSLLADVHEEQAVCKYVNSLGGGRRACAATVGAVKSLEPDGGMHLHPCFTGAVYRVVPIEYQGRRVGRFVVGPYLPAETSEVPKTLLRVDDAIEPNRASSLLAQMPRVKRETAERISSHLRGIIDLLLFASHRAHLTSEMHVASVRESYRELAEKTANLQQAYDRLKELDKLKSNFLATVSHELRTPLTSIIGYSEMLSSGIAGDMNDEQVEFVDTIRTKGDHLLALITSLLDLGKLEQGSLRLKREPVHARALLDDIATTLAPQAGRKNVTVEVDASEELPPIDGDPVRIRQVLSNLGDNAVKFTPEGGTVYLKAELAELEDEADGGRGLVLMSLPRRAVAFSIRDTGVGIARDELPRIFDAFYQVDGSSTREHGGAGLGLSIVKRLVDAHGGRVEVDSAVGAGTTFVVTLPEEADDG